MPLLGRWWSEGSETVFSWRQGSSRRGRDRTTRARASVFEQEGEDRFRTVAGDERGEAMRVVRDDSGAVVKLYWATYPFTRAPEIFGA